MRATTLPAITAVNAKNLRDELRRNVAQDARVMTDDAWYYKRLHEDFRLHETVVHSKGEYARGDVSTNTVEGFFALLKRGIYGTFHSVSKRHLHRYVAEFEFRYNARKLDDGARTVLAIKGSEGKRLRYREPLTRSA